MICQNGFGFIIKLIKCCALFSICAALLFAFFGCADREEEQRSEESEKASKELIKAEEAMKKAGINIFGDAGSLRKDNITLILPDPLEIGTLQRDNPELLKEAISSFYNVLEALPGQAIPAAPPFLPLAPAAESKGISKSDLALVHLHLGYLHVLSAVGQLTVAGMGADGKINTPDDRFFIELSKELNAKIYRFKLTGEIQARFDAIDRFPNPKPENYLQFFTEAQRQAILDSLVILLGVKVRILPAPAAGIKEQTAKVDVKLHRRDMLFHLEKAVLQAKEIAPNLEEAFDEFNRVLAEAFSKDLLSKTEKWGFQIENKAEVEARLKQLLKK